MVMWILGTRKKYLCFKMVLSVVVVFDYECSSKGLTPTSVSCY